MNRPKGIKLPKAKRKWYVISEDCKKEKTEIVTVVNDVMAEKNKAKIVASLFDILRGRSSTALGRSCERTPLHLGHLSAFEDHYYFLIHSSISISDNPCCRNFSRIRANC